MGGWLLSAYVPFCLFVCRRYGFALRRQRRYTGSRSPLPNTNQTKRCWVNYVKFHKCRIAKGADDEECRGFHQAFRSMCPNEWVEAWDEQRSNKIFPGLPRNLQ